MEEEEGDEAPRTAQVGVVEDDVKNDDSNPIVVSHSDSCLYTEDASASSRRACKGYLEVDRCLRAKERGYDVSMTVMQPPSCTPKNHMLIGNPTKQTNKARRIR